MHLVGYLHRCTNTIHGHTYIKLVVVWGALAALYGVLEAAVIWYKKFISCSKIFLMFHNLRLFIMTTNLFVFANVKQLRT